MAMLCCVSRKAAGAAAADTEAARCRASAELSRFVEVCRDLGKVRQDEDEALRKLDEAVMGVTAVANSFSTFTKLETLPEESFFDTYRDSAEGTLQQCTVCDRKFNSHSYERHVKICERTAVRKRKPFDSSKQRIQGTDLAEFQHKKPAEPSVHEHHQPTRRPSHGNELEKAASRRPSGAWKEKSEELRRSIKAVKDKTQQRTSLLGSPQQSSQQQAQSQHQRPSTLSLVTSPGAPQRSNEKGTCPTCQRQFGVKSYERHIAFCRERATRLPSSPQARDSLARERLDARMKYRAPGLKNRKPTNKEKYSPAGVQLHKVLRSPPMPRDKSLQDAPKLPQLKRPGQTKESPITTSGPLKSRPMDRSNRSSDSQESLNPPAMRQLFASRRLLLLSEVHPSKVLQSRNSLSSSSSQKSSANLVTNFLRKKFAEDSPYVQKAETLKQKLKKKIRFRARAVQRVRADEDEEDVETIEMVQLTQQTREYLTWKQIREEVRNNKNNDCESIDKIEEPILSHRTGLSSRDDGNSTMDEFEMNEKLARYRETDQDNADERAREINVDNPTLDRTFDVDEPTGLAAETEAQAQQNKEIENANNESDDADDDDQLSLASTRTFNKSDRQIDSIDTTSGRANNPPTPRTRGVGESEKLESNSQADKNDELTIVTDKIKEKLLSRPKKYLSLPNIAEMREQRTPRVSRMDIEAAQIKEENDDEFDKEQGNAHGRNKESPLPLINYPTRRCATYVVDKPLGDGQSKAKSLQSSDSKMLYDYYRNASFSDLSSVRTQDLQITDYDFEDFTDESNASELLKEIDACLMNTNLLESQDFTRKPRTRIDRGTRRCRNARMNASLNEREEETSESTLELSDFRAEKPMQQLEKEFCTITRLDSISRDNCTFLPPIAGNRATECRREKLVKSKPLRDIAERDTPSDEGDERFERFSKTKTRSRTARRSGSSHDPFYLLAEQQMNDLFSDTSEQSSTDGSSSICPLAKAPKANRSPNVPLSHSSGFGKYPGGAQCQGQSLPGGAQQRRASAMAPPAAFDDSASSELSSEPAPSSSSNANSRAAGGEREHVLGRRVIIDRNQALGGGEFAPSVPSSRRALSGSSSSSSNCEFLGRDANKAGSNVSLNSMFSSSDAEMKRSASLFDELLGSFDDDDDDDDSATTLPSLVSLMRNDPLLSSAPQRNGHRQRTTNPRINCSDDDAELSSPESVKRRECAKLSADSAYSSLNRKYSNHERSANDVSSNGPNGKCKMSKFCHECGFKFPDSAKFCCECGVRRLTL